MKGTIRQQGKHSWQIAVDMGKGPDGKRLRHYESVKGRKSDAQRRLNELLVNLEKGITASPGKTTVADNLHNWLEGYVKTNCSPRTLEGYTSICERQLIPALGRVQLKHLQPQMIQAFYGQAVSGRSARTVHHYHRVLSESLKYAVRQGILGRNPCEMVAPPSPRKKAMRTLAPQEVEVLLKAAEGSYYYPIIYTALSTGLRQAELLGLRMRDLNLETCSLSVTQVLYKRGGVCQFKEPKTEHSRRRVSLTPKLAIFLREYLARTSELRTLTLDSLVFANESGGPVCPNTVSHAFHKIAVKCDLAGLRFHDLRHSFASIMLLRGAKPKVISEALGHSSVAFTMDVYSHIIDGMQEDAMSLLNEVLPPGVIQGGFVASSGADVARDFQHLALCPSSSGG